MRRLSARTGGRGEKRLPGRAREAMGGQRGGRDTRVLERWWRALPTGGAGQPWGGFAIIGVLDWAGRGALAVAPMARSSATSSASQKRQRGRLEGAPSGACRCGGHMAGGASTRLLSVWAD